METLNLDFLVNFSLINVQKLFVDSDSILANLKGSRINESSLTNSIRNQTTLDSFWNDESSFDTAKNFEIKITLKLEQPQNGQV